MSKHILVVEDHRPLLSALKDILEAEGMTVSIAKDGVQALEVMEHIKPDLILADIMMPRMDGYDLYSKVRARPEWVPIPFIFLTAKSEQQDVLKGKGMGAEAYIVKPFDTKDLIVTIRSRLERAQAIRRSTETEFEKLKQQIVTALGHELRTPLTYVTGYTELALEDISSLSPADFENFLVGIKRGADRLTNLVEDLLLLMNLDMGRAAEEYDKMASTHHGLYHVLRRVVESYTTIARTKKVILELNCEPDLPKVRLYEFYFANALGRLIENGIKFSKEEGQRVAVTVRVLDNWVEIDVADEGLGIPPESQVQIFERFRQVGRDRWEQQGVGLGLSIAQELIALHGGNIELHSEVNRGSTFSIRLPIVKDS
jgi:signal transduction histidine kinase